VRLVGLLMQVNTFIYKVIVLIDLLF